MGFLSGVLSNIKDHLGQHKNEINNAIDALNKNKHAGKNGFNAAIGEVVKGVRGYNERVRESNERISGVINEFTNQMEIIAESVKNYNDHNSFQLIDVEVSKCIQRAIEYREGMELAEMNVNDLKNDLEHEVRSVTKTIAYQRWRLDEIWKNKKLDLEQLSMAVRGKLDMAKNLICRKIRDDIEFFIKQLNEKVLDLKSQIERVNRMLLDYVNELNKWIDKAHDAVNVAIEKVHKILDEISGNSDSKLKQKLVKNVADLHDTALALYRAYDSANKNIPQLVEQVTRQINLLDEKIQQDLEKLKDRIDDGIERYVTDIRESFDILKEQVLGFSSTDNKDSMEYNWPVLQGQIKNFVDLITGTKGKEEGLEGIKTKIVDGYSKRFRAGSNSGLEAVVMEWIQYSLLNDTGVKGWLGKWVKDRTANGGNYFKSGYITAKHDGIEASKTRELAEKITKKLKTLKMTMDDAHVDSSNETKIHAHIKAVQKCIDGFAQALWNKIDEEKSTAPGDTKKFIRDIVDAIEAEIRNSYTTSDYDYAVERAAKIIVSALHSAARRVSEELKLFTGIDDRGYNIGKNVDDAMKWAYKIKANLNIDAGNNITKALNNIKEKIGLLDHELEAEKLKKRIESKFSDAHLNPNEVRKVMTRYGCHVGKSGHIDTAVKNLRNYALEAFDKPVKARSVNESSIDKKAEDVINTHLKEFCDAIIKAAASDPDSATVRLSELKHTLISKDSAKQSSLRKIGDDLTKLQNVTLRPLLGVTQKISTYASTEADAVLRKLLQYITEGMNSVSNDIVEDIRTKYVLFMRSQLTAFSTEVNKELGPLPSQITDDANKSYKGFMKQFVTYATSALKKSSKASLSDFCPEVKRFFTTLLGILDGKPEILPKHEATKKLYDLLKILLTDVTKYDTAFTNNLASLQTLINNVRPQSYDEERNALLYILIKGLKDMHAELDNAYISAYDSETTQWTETGLSTGLTQNAHRCAKIFLTTFSTIYDAVHDLRINCNSLKGHQIHSSSDLGRLFLRHGFKVSDGDKQHWELQSKSVINGEYVANRISYRVDSAKENKHLIECESNKRKSSVLFNLFDILKCILHHVDQYNATCHIALLPKPRTPCTVFEMLVWLSGLTYTSAYQALLSDGFTNVLDNPDKPLAGDGEISVFDIEQSYLEAHPQRITYKSISKVLEYICSKSYDLLTTIVGHGDAATFYACDYSNNTLNLYYPSSGEECLQMLLDFLRRILQPLRYLFERCSVADKNYGWADCHYGRDVPTTKSHCNNKPTDDVTCQPNCQPNCKPNCQPTSPLMNYLSDSLLGYLPHRLESVGCKSKCSTCPSTARLGMPCATPLGFRAFSGSTKTGHRLREMIRLLIGSDLISSLLSLVVRPPSTLPEHFGFGLSLVNKWVNVKSYLSDSGTKPVSQSEIEASIEKLSIKLYTDTGKLTNVLRDAYGNSQHEHEGVNHLEVYADVSSLCMTRSCTDRVMRCAPYLSTLCSDTYQYLVHKNFATYLTWAVYLPWDFWTQLNNLCNAFKNIFCQDWGCHMCLRADKCKRGQHGLVEKVDKQPAKPHCKCPSMVQCKGVSATLYQFGFSFGNAATLNNETSAKKCSDFCSQLDKVLKSDYFVKLFTECDNFIWTIREPFTYLVLALWSLSLFYLIYVMVGRLDLLHIKSHLRTPSSHKITAQSLLAAAQVGRLAKISYLQP